MKPLLNAISTLIFLFISGTAFSQTDSILVKPDVLTASDLKAPLGNKNMEVVSASRTSKKIIDLPVTIHVITREEILENGYITLVDALKSLPGIKVSQPGTAMYGEMFQMRGMLGNGYAKILINDIPVRPTVVAGMPLEAQLPVRQAERIEVIYGPASALYGADAAVGVINIITKEGDNGIFSEADISLGPDGYGYVNFHAGGKAGRNKNTLKYSFYGSKHNVDHLRIFQDTAVYHPMYYLEQRGFLFEASGQTILPTSLTTEMAESMGLSVEDLYNPDYEGTIEMPKTANIPTQSQLIGLNLKFRGFSVTMQNMIRQTHSSIGRTPFLYKYNNPRNYIADRLNRVTYSYTGQFRKFGMTTNLSILDYSLDPYSGYGVTYIEGGQDTYYQYADSKNMFFEQLFNFNIKKIELTAGATVDLSADLPLTNYLKEPFDTEKYLVNERKVLTDDSIEAFGYNPLTYGSGALFLQAYYSIGRFNFMAGLRSDYNTLYMEQSFNPRGAILYKITDNMSVRASAGRAYKAPTGNQLYEAIAFPNTSDGGIHYAIVPSPDLKPEYFRAYEIGLRNFWLNERIYTDISAFYNFTDNLITTGYIDPVAEGYPDANNYSDDPYARKMINSSGANSKLYGVDINIDFRQIWQDRLRLTLSSTINKGTERLSSGDVLDYLRSVPAYTGKMSLYVKPTRRLYINLKSTWVSSWEHIFIPTAENTSGKDYSKTDGYIVFDMITGFNFHKNLNLWLKIINLTDEQYGGIDGTGFDVDLAYNPQLARSVRFGMTFNLN